MNRASSRLAVQLTALSALVVFVLFVLLMKSGPPGGHDEMTELDAPGKDGPAQSQSQDMPPSKIQSHPPQLRSGALSMAALGFARVTKRIDPLEAQMYLRPRDKADSQSRQKGALTKPADGDALKIVLGHLRENASALGHQEADFADVVVTGRTTSEHNGVTHLYLRQQFQGIEVYNGDLNTNVTRDGRILNLNDNFVSDLSAEVGSTRPVVTAEAAVKSAARQLGLRVPDSLQTLETEPGAEQRTVFAQGELSADPIPARLMFLPQPGGRTRLVWNTVLRLHDGQRWFEMNVDGETGEVLSKANWIARADYRVYPMPLENPDGGARSLVTNPHDATASPFGWHDTDGVTGAEFTDTRGNNVNAQEDRDADNAGGFRPDGGTGLQFDFPIDPNQQPTSYEPASITNLFYWNNLLHDLHYHYGFNEAAGNFQRSNYGRGGQGGDAVEADSLDGSGLNNANFGTPPEGYSPRMQMFLWTGADGSWVVNSPASVAGTYSYSPALFGPALTAEITAGIVQANDGSAAPSLACQPLVNGSAIAGNIALIDRGGCNYVDKVRRAQAVGAVAVLVANNIPGGGTFSMGGIDPLITIPAFMISFEDGQALKGALSTGVNATVRVQADRDSSLDNLIIIHEYGHGVSNRLTGGPANASALQSVQSRGLGEGWSDWWGLVFTAKAGQTAGQERAVGNYVLGQNSNGPGIRPYPYTTDLAANPQTFGDLTSGTLSVPHGIGSVWCTILWEVYWELVGAHGFDPDFYHGTGGNNVALQLIMDGLKLQPANPTYLDARDAILLADEVDNGGANLPLLWRAFAKRGMGFSAYDDGNPNSLEVVEAFDLPDDLMISPGARSPYQPAGGAGGPFTPASRVYTLENTGPGPLQWSASSPAPWLDLVPSSGTLLAGQTTSLTASLNSQASALGMGNFVTEISIVNATSGADQRRGVNLSVNGLADALDVAGHQPHTSSPAWFSQSNVTYDGVDAAQSGAVDHGESSVMEMSAVGPDTVTFRWKVSSEEYWDYLLFIVDGQVQHSISGAVDWSQVTYELPPGPHVIRWEYQKDFSVDDGLDAGWVDQVGLASDQPPIINGAVVVRGYVGEPFSYQIMATQSPTTYSSGPLPGGLSLNPNTGEISGIPASSGAFAFEIRATNAFGTGTATLSLGVYEVATLPFAEDFESGSLADVWRVGKTNQGRTEVTQSNAPHAGGWHVTMDTSSYEGSRNELDLALNLAGQSGVVLLFWAKEFNDRSDGPPPSPFSGGADFDGVAISEDGEHWYEARPLRGEMRGAWRQFAVDLDKAAAEHGLTYDSRFHIRFNHFGNAPIPANGFALDDILIQNVVLQTSLSLASAPEDTSQVFQGSGTPGALISLISNRDGVLGETIAASDGSWTLSVSGLQLGAHDITASVAGIPMAVLRVTITPSNAPAPISKDLIPFGSLWRFRDDGSNLYTSSPPFFDPAFNDSAWSAGEARLGYGGDGEVTVLNGGSTVCYFRKTFVHTPGTVTYDRGLLSLYADDGAVVYVNGVELRRHNMPTGTVGFQTQASSQTNNDQERGIQVFEFDKNLILEGANTVAVAVHQRPATSNDCGFDLRLALIRNAFFTGVDADNTFRETEMLAMADVDGDGLEDMIYTRDSTTDSVRYRLNLGNSLLGSPQTIASDFYEAQKPLISDLNQDGRPDVVVYSLNGTGIRVFRNTGSGFSQTFSQTGFEARGTSLADLDGDGFDDLVYQYRTNNDGTYEIYWRRNNQSAGFGSAQLIAIRNMADLSVGDMDGDGDMDVIVAQYFEGNIAWFENNGSGAFANEHVVVSGLGQIWTVLSGDLDEDNDVDLLVDLQGQTYWFENDGAGAFGRQWGIELTGFLDTIRLEDLDSDGDLDLLCHFDPFNSHLEWRENDGKGNFSRAQRFIKGGTDALTVSDLEIGDFDGDGFADVVVVDFSRGELDLYRNRAGASPKITSFSVNDNTVAPGGSVTLSWTVENADEVRLDGLVVPSSGSALRQAGDTDTEFVLVALNADGRVETTVTVFVPEPSFQTETVVTEGAFVQLRDLAVGDLDGNGTQDIVVAAYNTHKVAWVSNDGSGQFSAPIFIDSSYTYPAGAVTGDFDRDGDTDVVMISGEGAPLSLYRNLGGGTFGPRQVIDASIQGSRLRTRDMNRDGTPDLIFYASNAWRCRLGIGDGTFLAEISIGLGPAEEIAFAHLDDDGVEDLIYLISSNLYVRRANAILDYPSANAVSVASSLWSAKTIEVDDFDNDSFVDIMVTMVNSVGMFFGKGELQFDPVFNQVDHLGDIVETILADFDRDGHSDIAVLTHDSPNLSSGSLYWIEGDGRGRFSEVQLISETVPDGWILDAADLDGDGDLDLLVGSDKDKIVWSRNITVRPQAPALSSESDSGTMADNVTNTSNADFSGSASPGTVIRLFSNLDGILGTARADGAGLWTITTGKLSDGVHHLNVATNGGEVSDRITVLIDTVATPPGGLNLNSGSTAFTAPEGGSGLHLVSDSVTPVITGSAEAGSTIVLTSSIDGVVGQGVANSEFWITTTELSEGLHQMTAVATDLAGNVSAPSSPMTLLVDLSPPTVAISSPVSAPGYTAGSRPIALGGTAGDGVGIDRVEWTNDRGGSGTATGGESWSVAALPLETGVNLVTITAFDLAGKSAQTTLTVTYAHQALALADWNLNMNLTGPAAAYDAVPFKDGVANLLKYAFNLHGDRPDSRTLLPGTGTSGLPAPFMEQEPEQLVFALEFLRRKGAGLTYEPLVSTNLVQWNPMTGVTTVTPINDDWERVTIRQSYPMTPGLKIFGRVRVSAP